MVPEATLLLANPQSMTEYGGGRPGHVFLRVDTLADDLEKQRHKTLPIMRHSGFRNCYDFNIRSSFVLC